MLDCWIDFYISATLVHRLWSADSVLFVCVCGVHYGMGSAPPRPQRATEQLEQLLNKSSSANVVI